MKNYIIIIILLWFTVLSWAADQELGNEVTIIKLHNILTNPSEFADKPVVLEGIFAQRNCNYCFMYKEGIDTIKITPKGFFSPKFKPGTRIQIKGIVRIAHGEEITIEALEVQKK